MSWRKGNPRGRERWEMATCSDGFKVAWLGWLGAVLLLWGVLLVGSLLQTG